MPLIKLLLVLAFAGLIPGAKDNSSQTSIEKTTNKQEFFSYIRCHRQAKNIVINWGMTSVNGVHHFVVYHSELGDFFDPIEEVFPDGTSKYSFKHESVFAGYHYYYIAAVMNAGPAVNSPVDVVRIVSH
ncbi:MAG TPA: hypothetical protein VFU29_22835 [Chitinophagaceae bacterium]|nr:hypothetical protein [Chitinophagaceae bacterium]